MIVYAVDGNYITPVTIDVRTINILPFATRI